MTPHNDWQWQQRGTAWKGIGIYHMTLTVSGRQPLLGDLVIPDDDPLRAYVSETPLAKDLVQCLLHLHERFPEIRVLQFCVMPDHLHAIIHVWRPMPRSIKLVMRSFWQADKHLRPLDSSSRSSISSELYSDIITPADSSCRSSISSGLYPDNNSPLFSEVPFLRPLSRQGQLQTMIQYVQMNPARLATKRLKPEFFCVQPNVEINGHLYSAVGNSKLLAQALRTPVHVRHTMTEAARLGNPQPLNDYIASCYDAARQGSVMVSPFISSWEKDILHTLLAEQRPIIYLAQNGFKDFYKPSALLFDAVASGRLLILSPWPYDPTKQHVSRADCIALNTFAENICSPA